STRSRERFPTTASRRTRRIYPGRDRAGDGAQRERDREARERCADVQRPRVRVADQVGPPRRSGRLKPLVGREPEEPRGDSAEANARPSEEIVPRVRGAREQPVGEQHAEERYEERAEQVEEVEVVAEVDHERA